MQVFFGVLYKVFAFFGFLLLVAVGAAAFLDYTALKKDLDLTKLERRHTTEPGKPGQQHYLVKRGMVLDVFLECDNNYVRIEVSSLKLYYRELNDTLKAKHAKLVEACKSLQPPTSTPVVP